MIIWVQFDMITIAACFRVISTDYGAVMHSVNMVKEENSMI
jgi:hypothetical protein